MCVCDPHAQQVCARGAAPSPHRPHHPCRPCRRKKHLTSLAEAAGIELEEMIFFDNERGNCLVRIYVYMHICICVRTYECISGTQI